MLSGLRQHILPLTINQCVARQCSYCHCVVLLLPDLLLSNNCFRVYNNSFFLVLRMSQVQIELEKEQDKERPTPSPKGDKKEK